MNGPATLLLLVLSGALLCNCVPHLTSGTRGEPFPTPFARPRGVGLSPPVTNVLWGIVNLFAGVAIVISYPERLSLLSGWIALAIGFLASGLFLARHFGKVRRERKA